MCEEIACITHDTWAGSSQSIDDVGRVPKRRLSMKRLLAFSVPLAVLLFELAGCIGHQYATPSYDASLDTLRQISDEDIRNALNARPQLLPPVNLAVYNSGYPFAFNSDSLRHLDGISRVYEIPRVLVDGGASEDATRHSLRYYRVGQRPIDQKQLRLLAAQAKCDLLLLYHVTVKEDVETNALIWTHILIIPGLFMPSFHVNLSARGDAFYFDVRNGYLYCHATAETTYARRYVTYWTTEQLPDLRNELVATLGPALLQQTSAVLNDKRFFLDSAR
jgi:hypothetical protein